MRRLVVVVAGVAAGYIAGAIFGALLIGLFSGNTHDKELEIAMTAVFVTGPMGGLIGMIAAALWRSQTAKR